MEIGRVRIFKAQQQITCCATRLGNYNHGLTETLPEFERVVTIFISLLFREDLNDKVSLNFLFAYNKPLKCLSITPKTLVETLQTRFLVKVSFRELVTFQTFSHSHTVKVSCL